jgi:glutathionyl-hydroquinone reductase
LIVRELKGLQDIIGKTVVHYHMGENGWKFVESKDELEGSEPEPFYGAKYIKDIYHMHNPDYTGRYTVPVLWDKKTKTIVNNESSEIIRMFYTEFDEFIPEEKRVTYYPSKLGKQIDEVNDWVYDTVNNGLYNRCCVNLEFTNAGSQQLKRHMRIMSTLSLNHSTVSKICLPSLPGNISLAINLQRLTSVCLLRLSGLILSTSSISNAISELSDTSAFSIFHGIDDSYPKLNAWLKHLYWEIPAFKDSTNFLHIKAHYMTSHPTVCFLPSSLPRSIPIGSYASGLFPISSHFDSLNHMNFSKSMF